MSTAVQEPKTIRGMVVELDPKLKPAALPSRWAEERPYYEKNPNWLPPFAQKDRMLDQVTRTNRGTLNKQTQRHEQLVGNIYHANYLSYLEFCYSKHWTPVFTPDILWFTCLNEIATTVRDHAEALRELFTFAKEGKTEITVLTGNPYVLPVKSVVQTLREYVPMGVDQFLPEFTTTTESSRLAFAAAFCDVVSPYYSYSMMLCGFPRMVIQGTVEDYVKIAESWRNMPNQLKRAAGSYWTKAQQILEDIVVNFEGATRETDKSRLFWQGIFKAQRCGSGSQTEVEGWFTDLFQKGSGTETHGGRTYKGPRYASNFDPHVAKVDYKLLDTGQEFSMLQGVFSSTLGEGGVAVPEFGSLVFETTK